MTQEEKAKAYDEALAKAAKIHRNYKGRVRAVDVVIEEVFPEFQESEDERIRKALIDGFTVMKESKNCGKTFSNHNIPVVDILAWLKKQGEQKPIETTWKPNEEQIKILDEILNFAANHESPYWYDYIFGTLNNLIRQLKKLKT